MASGVVFRRIGGRIVPIKSETKHNVEKGAATTGAGVGLAYVAGKHSAKLMHESAIIEHSARVMHSTRHEMMTRAVRHGPLFVEASRASAEKLKSTAAANIEISKRVEKAAFRTRHVGTALAAVLIAHGVHQVTKGTELEKHPKTHAAIAAGSGIASAFIVRSSYLRGVGMRGAKVLGHAARRAFLKI